MIPDVTLTQTGAGSLGLLLTQQVGFDIVSLVSLLLVHIL